MAQSNTEQPSWLQDFCTVRSLSKEIQRPLFGAPEMNIPRPKIMWYVWRIWSRSIYDQLQRHHDLKDKLFSDMMIGKIFCDYLKEFSGSFNYEESFLVLELSVINQPKTKYGQKILIIDAVWKRSSNNLCVPEECRRWKILVYNELAQLFQYTLKKGDLLLIWGGRVQITEENRIVIINHQSSNRAVICMYRHDGRLEPTRCEDGNFIAPYCRSEEFSMVFRSKATMKDILALMITSKTSTIELTNYVPLPLIPDEDYEGERSIQLETSENVNGQLLSGINCPNRPASRGESTLEANISYDSSLSLTSEQMDDDRSAFNGKHSNRTSVVRQNRSRRLRSHLHSNSVKASYGMVSSDSSESGDKVDSGTTRKAQNKHLGKRTAEQEAISNVPANMPPMDNRESQYSASRLIDNLLLVNDSESNIMKKTNMTESVSPGSKAHPKMMRKARTLESVESSDYSMTGDEMDDLDSAIEVSNQIPADSIPQSKTPKKGTINSITVSSPPMDNSESLYCASQLIDNLGQGQVVVPNNAGKLSESQEDGSNRMDSSDSDIFEDSPICKIRGQSNQEVTLQANSSENSESPFSPVDNTAKKPSEKVSSRLVVVVMSGSSGSEIEDETDVFPSPRNEVLGVEIGSESRHNETVNETIINSASVSSPPLVSPESNRSPASPIVEDVEIVDYFQVSLEDKNSPSILDNVGDFEIQTKSKRKLTGKCSGTSSTGSLTKVCKMSGTEVDDSSAGKAGTSSQKNSKAVKHQLVKKCFVRLERLKDL